MQYVITNPLRSRWSFISDIPQHMMYIRIGEISIEYFVINTNLPDIAAIIIIAITDAATENNPIFILFFNPFIINTIAISEGTIAKIKNAVVKL